MIKKKLMNKIKVVFLVGLLVFLNNCGKPQSHKQEAITNVVPIVTIAPNYPRKAAIANIEGDVTIEFTVTTTGIVTNPVIIESNPPRIFDREALRAILNYKFKPKSINGQFVDSRATQKIEFKLNNPNEEK